MGKCCLIRIGTQKNKNMDSDYYIRKEKKRQIKRDLFGYCLFLLVVGTFAALLILPFIVDWLPK